MKWFLASAVIFTMSAVGHASDETAPAVLIHQPYSRQTLYERFTVKATATDNVAVEKVVFYLDGEQSGNAPLATITVAPYSFKWDSRTATPGAHTIQAVAIDTSGNKGYDTQPIIVSNVMDKCQDFATKLTNNTPGEISFAMNGTAPLSGMGSVLKSIRGFQTDIVDLPAGKPKIGGTYSVGTYLQTYNGQPITVSCTVTAPANSIGCPKSPYAAKMSFALDQTGKPRCLMMPE